MTAAAMRARPASPAPRQARARAEAPLRVDLSTLPAAELAERVRRLWAERDARKLRIAVCLAERRAWLTAAEIAAAVGCEEGQADELCMELLNDGLADLHVTAGTWRYGPAEAPVPGPGGVTWVSVLHATLRAALGRDLEPGEDPIALWAAWSQRAEQAAQRRRPRREEVRRGRRA